MKILRAYKFELVPTGEQFSKFCQFAGCRRFVYNQVLALQIENHSQGKKHISGFKMHDLLPALKQEYPWLSDCYSQILQQGLNDLNKAYEAFFNKISGFPKFRRKFVRDSFRFPQPKREWIDQKQSRIKLPKIGWVKYRNSQKVKGKVKNMTISRNGEKWFISIQVEQSIKNPVPTSTTAVGIDVGIASFATFSDGSESISAVNALKTHLPKLQKLQRSLSRKQKFSSNWRKAKKKVTRLHSRIANIRKDFLHKATHRISNNHAMIALEDLKVSNMSTSSKGTLEKPGKNVKAKSGLNRSILDQGWYEFRRQLEYKSLWKGGYVIAVPPQYTSQHCPCCGHTHKDNRKTQAKFECVECGFTENADVVGAKNILARAHEKLAAGHAASACGELVQLGHSMKQEPPRDLLVA